MKLIFKRSWMALAAVGSVVWVSTAGLMAQTTPPEGSWDCLISGKTPGIAFIDFNSSGTLGGFVLLTQTAPVKHSKSVNLRDNNGTRGDTNSSPETITTAKTNWFGLFSLEGQWLNAGSGKILGFFSESGFQLTTETNHTFATNFVAVDTNVVTLITTNTEVSYSTNYVTNSFSFTAKASAKKITIKGTGILGDHVFTGRPAVPVTDLSGNYVALGTSNNLLFTEFLTLAPTISPYAFDVQGVGAGYTFDGLFVESAQRRAGLIVIAGGSSIPRFAVTGPLNTKKFTADLKGTDTDGSQIRYKLYKQP